MLSMLIAQYLYEPFKNSYSYGILTFALAEAYLVSKRAPEQENPYLLLELDYL